MAYYLLVRYYSNKGYILDNPHYYSSGVTSYSSVTASSSSSYKYFKTASTRTNQTSTVITGATTSGGTYGNVGNRYTASSTSTVCNLTNVSTFGLTRDGYHINADEAYKSSDGSKVYGQNGSSAPSAKRATISRLGGSTSANKTVSIYVNWIGNSYTVHFNASGGSGTMSDQTGFVFGTGKALSSNTFTRTGYTFAGWSKSSGSTISVYYVRDETTDSASAMGTDGTYLYLKEGNSYYRVTVDNSDSYTNVGTTAPSGVTTWVGSGSANIVNYQGNNYYFSKGSSEEHDWLYVYRVDGAQTVDYANQASMSDAGGQTPVEVGTTVVNLYAVWTETTPPSNLSITSTNNVASSQTVTLSATDNVGITGYYWGTSSSSSVTYTDVTSTTNWSTTKTVSSGSLYYLRVKDAAGNTNYTTKRFYKTSFEAANGSVSPSSVITMQGNSFVLPTPTPNSGYDVTNGYWVITDANYYLYGTTYTPTVNMTFVSGCAKSDAGKLPAVGVIITDNNNNFSITTNNNGEASIGVNTLNNIWEDYGETTAIFIGGSNAIKPSYCAETVMWNGGSTGYHMVDHGDYGVKVTIIDGYYHFYVYDLNSTAPKIYIKNNGTWKPAIAYVKISGEWKLMSTAYIKQNDTWKTVT